MAPRKQLNEITTDSERLGRALTFAFGKKRIVMVSILIQNPTWITALETLTRFGVSSAMGDLPDRYLLKAKTSSLVNVAVPMCKMIVESKGRRSNPVYRILDTLIMWALKDVEHQSSATPGAIEEVRKLLDHHRTYEENMHAGSRLVSVIDE